MTNVIEPKRRGMPPFKVGQPVIRLANYGKNAIIYFYQEAVSHCRINRGDGVRILETGGTFYLHIIRDDVQNITGYKIGGRNKFSLTAQLSGQAGIIPEGLFIVDGPEKHPEFNIIVYPLKFDHR